MSHPRRQLPGQGTGCRLVIVQDQLQPCPYLNGITARMPLRLPVGPVSLEVTDQLLAMGYRRSGDFLYRPQCPACQQCQATRVVVDQFRLTRSMRRVLNRGDRDLVAHWGVPQNDRQRLALFNRHRRLRHLGTDCEPVDAEAYGSFLVNTCCDSTELSLTLDDRLVGVAIVDIGRESLSAVYTQFEPDLSRYSLGTYAILKQIEWARRTSRRFVYLGMYVAANRHLNYKARFQPQQRLIDGQWTVCDEAPGSPPV